MSNQEMESLKKRLTEDTTIWGIPKKAQKKAKHSKVLQAVGYMAGSIALCAAGFVILPPLMSYVSGALYRASVKKANRERDTDDWGPVIERKEKPDESK